METLEFDVEFLAQKLSENPQSPLFARLADLYLAKNQTVEALKLCEEGIKLFPQYYAGHLVLGKTHAALKEYSKANAAFQKAQELSPFNLAIKKLIESAASSPDESVRTTDEDYFTAQPSSSPESSTEKINEAGQPETPLNGSLFDALTPEELNYIQQSNAGTSEISSSTDLGYGQPTQQNFPSFDEYYSEHQPHIEKSSTIALDDYLTSKSGAEKMPVNVSENIPEQPVEESAVREEVRESSEQEFQSPVSQQQSENVTEPEAQISEEPEMVFSSPEQAQLFAELNETSDQPQDLDQLAEKLQNAERIVPGENYETKGAEPEQQESSAEYSPDMVTPTLAEIYASQGEYRAAIQAYEILMFSQPDKGAAFQKRIQELQQMQMEKDGLI